MTERLIPDAAGLARAAALLCDGRLVAFGTETVYGLGADATSAAAIAAVFAAKDRPRFNPLICHYPNAEAAFADTVPGPAARLLAAAFWPGPLTLVLPRRPDSLVAPLTGAGLDTLAVRVPAPPTARALLAAVGRPVAAPSANRSGQVSPTTATHVLEGLGGRIAAVLDSGPCAIGVESTVLDLSGERPRLLRPGGVPLEALMAHIGPLLSGIAIGAPPADGAAPRAPGQLASHYATTLPVRLNAASVEPDEALLAFGPPLAGAGAVFNLSPAGDPTEAAVRLFAGLRTLDTLGAANRLHRIAAMPVPDAGLGRAINDRLTRAAAPR
ncbi:MAG: L-threonylcarbamoyladenylate synthase [Acetobacteraceae bacterium]